MNKKSNFYSINLQSITRVFFCLYISSTYLAQNVILPSSYNSIFLYLFLLFGIIGIFISKTLKLNKMSYWMLLFMGYSIFTMIYSPTKSIFDGQFYFLLVNYIIISVLSQLEFDEKLLLCICWVYSLSAGLLTIFFIATGNMSDSTGRLGNEAFGNANTLAILLMIAAMAAFYLLIYFSNALWKKVGLIFCIGLSYYSMFLSGGRKFVIVPIIFLYILLFFKADRKGRKHIIRYTLIIIAIIIILYQLIMKVPAFYHVIGSRMEGLINTFLGVGNAEASAESRGIMIAIGLKKWLDSPIWGYGFDSFKYYNLATTGGFYYAHNNFVEILYDLGIVGFILYYYFYFKILKKGLVCFDMPANARAFSVATIISFLIYEFGAVNYSSTPAMIMLFLAYKVQDSHRKDSSYE